jgi:hypothetical protein
MSKIVSLSAENVKKITAVHIEPGSDGTVLIGGKNGAGKSSVLDSIMMALGGAASLPAEPIRRGEESATIRIELDDLLVERRFTPSGSTVKVKTKDGASYSSPQKILDGLFSKLSFDPLKFSQMKPDDQARTLIELVGIDTTDLDNERDEVYEERTAVNRLVKEAQVDLSRVPAVESDVDIPEVRPDVVAVRERIRLAEAAQREHGERERRVGNLQSRVAELKAELETLAKESDTMGPEWEGALTAARDRHAKRVSETAARHERELMEMKQRHADEIARLSEQIQEDEQRIVTARTDAMAANAADIQVANDEIARIEAELKPLLEVTPESSTSIEELHAELKHAMFLESAFDQHAMRLQKEDVLKSRQQESESLTKRLEDIAARKREKLASANYPIEGLTVSENGTVLFNEIPFSQASRAQQIRTSVAIGIAMNPKLKVLLIHDGSLLDDDGLALVAEMARQHDAQIWIERVGDKDESAIIIEDGHVRGVAADEKPAEPVKKTRRKSAKSDGLFVGGE